MKKQPGIPELQKMQKKMLDKRRTLRQIQETIERKEDLHEETIHKLLASGKGSDEFKRIAKFLKTLSDEIEVHYQQQEKAEKEYNEVWEEFFGNWEKTEFIQI